MRYHKISELIISEDEVSSPQLILFQDKFTLEDKGASATLQDLTNYSQNFGIGAHSIDLTNLPTVNYLYVKPLVTNITIDFNGEVTPKTFAADRASELFMVFTQLDITTTADTRIIIAIGSAT